MATISLTDEQQKAVTASEKRIKVLAGAGSGKTRTLAERVNYLIETGVAPENIMAITFTRKASEEIEERCQPGIVSGTFHSVIIRAIDESISVIDEDEQDRVLKKAGKDLGMQLSSGRWIKNSTEHHKKHLRAYREGKCEPNILVQTYLSRLRVNKEYDYDGLLVKGIAMAKEHGAFDNLEHLIIDESQDCEPLQISFIQAVEESSGCSVMLVGDPSQSIYEWRGADPDALNKIECDATYGLSKTFRCPREVIDLANRLPLGDGLKLTTDKKEGKVLWLTYTAPGVVEKILDRGADPSEIAVLCRYGKQVEDYKSKLANNAIPIASKKKPPRGAIWSMLKWLSFPDSATSRESVASKWDGLSGCNRPAAWAAGSLDKKSVCDLIDLWMPESRLVEDVIQLMSPPISMHLEKRYFLDNHKGLTIDEAVSKEMSAVSENQKNTGVTVDTIHGAKGLEWPHVIVTDLQSWPRISSKGKKAGKVKEEEIRVFYVAVTRSMNNLYLLSQDCSGYFWKFR